MWYYTIEGKRYGPFVESRIKSFIRKGIIDKETFVWREGYKNWLPVKETELVKYFHAASAEISIYDLIYNRYSVYPLLDRLNDGYFINVIAAQAFRFIGILAAISGVYFIIEFLRIIFASNPSTEIIIVGLIDSILIAATFYVITSIWLYHAYVLKTDDIKRFPVITIITHFLKIIGENFATIGISVAIGGMFLVWLNFDHSTFMRALNYPGSSFFYTPGYITNIFWGGVLFFVVNLVISFFLLVFFYFLAEVIGVKVDIARNVWKIKKNTEKEYLQV